MDKSRLIIVDLSNFIFRAFYAIRPLSSPEGTPVNAVHGVLSMLYKMIQEYRPSHFVMARDTAKGSFRTEIDAEYKANRDGPPEDLVPQFALIDEMLEVFAIPTLQLEGYEADDIIGTLATRCASEVDELFIASGDKDLMQFVGGNVKMLDTMKSKLYDREAIFEKMGVYPEQIVDYLSLVGDTSDNIPGVKWIGAKGAAKLLAEFNDLDTIFENVEGIKSKSVKQKLADGKDSALLSKELIKIVCDLDVECNLSAFKYEFAPQQKAAQFMDKLGFKTMKERLFGQSEEAAPKQETKTEAIPQKKALEEIRKLIQEKAPFCLDVFWRKDDYLYQIDYLCLFFSKQQQVYFNDGQNQKELEKIFSLLGEAGEHQIRCEHSKSVYRYARSIQIDMPLLFDIGQAAFVANPDQKNGLVDLSAFYLGTSTAEIDQKKKLSFDSESSSAVEGVLEARCIAAAKIAEKLNKELSENGLGHIFYELDSPLQRVLAQMEHQGILLDKSVFEKLEHEFSEKIDQIKVEIDRQGGEDVNLNSPIQLRTLLFEKLGLPVLKKTKTGPSTDVEVLTKLQAMDEHPIPGLILQYRELDKLNGTYVKAIPRLVSRKTNRIHAHFNQNVAATGRLSSDRPNLQNIPVRTENGRKLRAGFVADKGMVLVGGDYSQIELRLLAHFSKDPTMIEAFNADKDIHAQTAAEVFGTPLSKVTSEQRSNAKAINFGLMYGQSSYGLSQVLGISRQDASDYITHYFTRFSKIKEFLDHLKEQCEKTGYAETLMGRKRQVPEINSQNRTVKNNAERIAINSPIQGTAADLIKTAMLKIDAELRKKKIPAKLLLQVHDELIFECPESEAETVSNLVKNLMESAFKLDVFLKVEMNRADNWFDLK